ncbi:MAG TPA: CHAT domain-containing protein, partial [Blastocatellia bacterium]|nr:CHAT domain-containing protein [Blastocatellia bacterium]
LGKKQEALGYHNQALSIQRAVSDREGEARTLVELGALYTSLAETQRALDCFNQALFIRRALGNQRGEAVALCSIGAVYDTLGEEQKALGYFNTALPLILAVGDRKSEAITLNNIGVAYDALGEKQKALDYYNQSLSIRRAIGDRPGEAVALNNMALTYDSLGEKQKALGYYNSALALQQAAANRGGEASVLNNIGFLYESLGEKQKALGYYNQSLFINRAVGDRRWEAVTLNNIGSVCYSLGETQKALDYYHQSLQLSKDVGDRIVQARNLFRIAQAERNRGDLVEARKSIEAALDITESLRTQVGSLEVRASYFATVKQYYDIYINLLMRFNQLHPTEGHNVAALQASERYRARSLLETLVEARADLRQGINPDLLERERSLLQRLNAKNERLVRLLSRGHTEQEAQEANTEIDKLATEFQQVQGEIRSKSPRYAALMQPRPVSLDEIQKQIVDADTLLLEYALGEERSFLWLVSPNSFLSFELPKRSVIEEAARHLYDLLTARARQVEGEMPVQRNARIARANAAYPAAATALSNMLLGPVAPHLGTKRLLIVSDGALQYIPFAALPEPFRGHPSGRVNRSNQPLVLEHEIINLPSASTLAVLRNELAGRQSAPKIAAVFADPVFEPTDLRLKRGTTAVQNSASAAATSDREASLPRLQMIRSLDDADMIKEGRLAIPRLPYSRGEAEAIKKLVPEKLRRLAVGLAVNHAAVTDPELENYAIVHFATHSLLNSKQPELSGVLLSLVDEHGQPQERGILSLGEIYNLKLGADMVVLSACRTALGKEVKGEGLIGLTRGFMYAGAARVVASLWKADDEATAELMTLFYQRMLGKQHLRPAAALRHAQIEMWRSRSYWNVPYYWAAFNLQGEWK